MEKSRHCSFSFRDDAFQREIEDLKATSAHYAARNAELTGNIVRLEAELDECRERERNCEDERTAVQADVQAATTEIKSLQAEVEILVTERRNLTNKVR